MGVHMTPDGASGVVVDRASDTGVARLVARAKPIAVVAFKVGLTATITIAVNLLVLLIAIPIGIMTDEVILAVVVAEGALLAVCLVAASVLFFRARRGEGAGLVIGWAIGYVGLITAIVALVVAAVVILVVAWVAVTLLWLILGG
jgi:hypothetical protein